MTPPKARPARSSMRSRKPGAAVDTVTLDAGHALMTEQPDATLDALFSFATVRSAIAAR